MILPENHAAPAPPGRPSPPPHPPPPPLPAAHHREPSQQAPTFGGPRRDRLQRGGTRGDHIFDHHHRRSRREIPLDPAPHSVLFRRLSHAERLHQGRRIDAGPGDRVRHRVGAHGEPSDRRGGPPRGADRLQAEPPDEVLALGGHRGLAGVDVVGGALARGKQKVAVAHGTLAEKGRERFPLGHSLPRRKNEERNPLFLAGVSPSATAQNAAANSPTVLNRRLRSRSSPVITAASIAGQDLSPLTASLSGIGAWVSSCWKSSRGLRPGKGSTPVSR